MYQRRAPNSPTTMQHDANCIFCRIVRGEIPSRKAYEDDDVLVFHDIQPVAPVHLLLIPKAHVATLYDATPQHAGVLGKIMTLAGQLARENGAGDGFRLIVNTGRVGRQEVMHVHVHVVGGGEPFGPMIVRKGP
jgi:histidine triad (HIT) family protein